MSTQLVTDIGTKEFTTKLNQVEFSSSDAYVDITITVSGIVVLNERYVPDADGNVALYDLGKLLSPYLLTSLMAFVMLRWTTGNTTDEKFFRAIYTSAIIEESTDAFCAGHFFTHATDKTTAFARKEVLFFYVDDEVTPACTAYYSDGTSITQNYPQTFDHLDTIAMLEVSPNNFTVTGKTLISYTVTAGERTARFTCVPPCEYAPALLYRNSFGVEETIYCVGTETLEPKYNYTTANIAGAYLNIDIEEVKSFRALTGVLTTAMSNSADDLFRAPMVQLFTLDGNGVIIRGRQVTITDAKSVRSNDSDFLPNFEFEYRYSQNNHNIFDKTVAGRIFDDTFDYSFE